MTDCNCLYSTRYRELVGTAETIVAMNRNMEEVDTTLCDIGRRCNPRLVGKEYTHLNRMENNKTTAQGLHSMWEWPFLVDQLTRCRCD
jgi:hypothetical protein